MFFAFILVMGDFNFPEINYKDKTVDDGIDSEAGKFFIKMEDLFWIQYVTEPTRARGTNNTSVPDYVFTNEENQLPYRFSLSVVLYGERATYANRCPVFTAPRYAERGIATASRPSVCL